MNQLKTIRSSSDCLKLLFCLNKSISCFTEPEKLLQNVCDQLVSSILYVRAVGVLKGRFGKAEKIVHSGFQDLVSTSDGKPIRKFFPECLKSYKHLHEYTVGHGITARFIDETICKECDFHVRCNDSVHVELIHQGRSRGWLIVTPSTSIKHSEQEIEFLENLAILLARSIDEKMIRYEYSILETQFRRVLQNTDDSIFGFDLNLKITFWNKGAEKLFGKTLSESIGMEVYQLFCPQCLPEFRELVESIKGQDQVGEKELICLDSRNERVSTIVSVWQEKDNEGLPIGYIAVLRDITNEMRAKEAALESENRFKTMYENIPGGMLIIGSDYLISDVNSRTSEITGYSKEELVGNYCDIICPKGSESRACPIWEDNLPEFSGMDTFIKCKDGTRKPIIKNAKRIVIDGDQYILENFQDVTTLKEVEAALKEREEKYRLLADNTLDCIWTMNLNMEITYINPMIQNMLGYSPEEFTGLSIRAFMPEIKAIEAKVALERELMRTNNQSGFRFETEFYHKSGIKVPIEIFGKVICDGNSNQIGLQGTARDISERKIAETERDRLISAIEQSSETIMISDCEGRIQYVNEAFELMTGFKKEDVIGSVQRIFRDNRKYQPYFNEMWACINEGKSWQGRINSSRADDSEYTSDVTVSPVFNSNGDFINLITVKRDISKELMLEDQLRHSQKMEAVGQLAGGVAHDFNNLLQVMSGYLELIKDDFSGNMCALNSLSEIDSAVKRAAQLVSQMLAFSRRQILRPVLTNLNDIIRGLMKMLHRIISENIVLEFIPGFNLGCINADPGMMEQILMNLCVNSRDAMPDGGSITIETENVVINSEYVKDHLWARQGRYVLLSVTDTGKGIETETQKKIFEPFFTTKEVGRGTGLGLSMVYGIIQQHKGMIRVYSELEHGTTFKIYLPIVERDAVTVGTKMKTIVKGGIETILIAEDDDMVRRLTCAILKRAGYKVLSAQNGHEAVELAEEHHNSIDLMIFDVVMPEMGGKAAADKIREFAPDIPVVYASGYNENAIHKNFVLDENVVLIPKPFAREMLLNTIRKVLDRDSGY